MEQAGRTESAAVVSRTSLVDNQASQPGDLEIEKDHKKIHFANTMRTQ